jgi:hypothetical protein
MSKKTFTAAIIITAFLVSTLAGAVTVEVAKANPFMFYQKVSPIPGSSPSQITIITPQNNTVYNSITIITFNLNSPTTTVGSCNIYYTAVTLYNNTALYSNNGGSLPQPFSFSPSPIIRFSEGKHSITVYSQAVFFPVDKTYFYLDNSSTVYFTIDTTPPSISNLSVMNKTYNSNIIPLSFNINKTVLWSGYSLDNKTGDRKSVV